MVNQTWFFRVEKHSFLTRICKALSSSAHQDRTFRLQRKTNNLDNRRMYFNSFLQHLQTHKTFSGSIALIHPKKVNLYNDSIHIAVLLTSRIVLSWGNLQTYNIETFTEIQGTACRHISCNDCKKCEDSGPIALQWRHIITVLSKSARY